uniref:FSA_C domain-containing protein n=1 Tax=Bursaphelenchus xylophilus TaxID=6326 RepID=A0A1I7S228_BURXY
MSNSTAVSILDNLADIDLLKQLQSDIRKEWKGDEPGINFFLLLGALLLFVTWAVFSVYFFSRVCGTLICVFLKRLLPYLMGEQQQLQHFSLGSFSVSLLAGKIMFREVLWVTDDYSLRINDGYLIFSFWRRVPRKEELEATRDRKHGDISRLHVSLNGVKLHFYNRLDLYQAFARAARGASASAGHLVPPKEQLPAKDNSAFSQLAKRVEEQQLEAWWDKFWRLVGVIVLDITSCRIIAGNLRMPYAFALVCENSQSKLYITAASNPEDQHMFRMKATLENVRISLVKQTGFKGQREDPPRTMGDGFAILQSATIHFFYQQDILGFVRQEDRQSATTNIPVWETTWRFDKNTVISYGPWADKRRAELYSFFFPSDYGIVPITEMPRRGEKRIFTQHKSEFFFIRDATIDMWFMRNDELNAIHSRIMPGSIFEFTVPWICGENGYTSVTKGTFLKLEATTSLPFRDFITCETARFNLVVHFPRNYNAHQSWNFGLELHQISTFLFWDHKRFLADLIDEWTSDNVSDLCRFVPYTWNFNINIVDQFEVILLLNDKNWVDTGASQSAENTQAAIVGNQLTISFSLPFDQFSPETIKVAYEIKAFSELALRIRVPTQSTIEPLFMALHNNAASKTKMKGSKVFVTAGSEQGFVEIWRTDSIAVRFDHEYHPIPSKVNSDIPLIFLDDFLPTEASHPAELAPDNLEIDISFGESEILLSGVLVRMIFDLKDDYFGSYDKISDINADKREHTVVKGFELDFFKRPELFRPMDCKLRIQLDNVQAHCLTFSPKTDSETPDLCPILFNEQIAVELAKTHKECLVQAQLAPTVVYFSPKANSANLSAFMDPAFRADRLDYNWDNSNPDWVTLDSFQFRGHGLYSDKEVPWAVEVVEYAWQVEVTLGQLNAKLQPNNVITVIHFAETFLTLALMPDESMQLPEEYNLCHHFENVKSCTKSNLTNLDPKDRRVKCLGSDTLKYKLCRVSLDGIDLQIHSGSHVVQLNSDFFRFAFCNSHNGTFNENLTFTIPYLKIRQLTYIPSRGIYAEMAKVDVKKVDMDIRLPYSEHEKKMPEERQKFLKKHDVTTRRLHFIWMNEEACGCTGDSHFFAAHDISGKLFAKNFTQKLAEIALKGDEEQYGFMQSILDRDTSGIRLLEDDLEEPEEVGRKLSENSFHSANSQTADNKSQANYLKYLELADIQTAKPESPQFSHPGAIMKWILKNTIQSKLLTSGVSELCLIRKEVQNARNSSYATSTESEPHFPEDWGKDQSAIYISGICGQNLQIFLTPPALEAVEEILEEFSKSLTIFHPAIVPQNMYFKCALSRHSQPLTVDLGKERTSRSSTTLNIFLNLPEMDLNFFQSEPAMTTEKEAIEINEFVSSFCLVHIDSSVFHTDNTASNDVFKQLNRRNTTAADNAYNDSNMNNLNVPSFSLEKDLKAEKNGFKIKLKSMHSQYLHLTNTPQQKQRVKLPATYITNFDELEAKPKESHLRLMFDLDLPFVDVKLSTGSTAARPPAYPTGPKLSLINLPTPTQPAKRTESTIREPKLHQRDQDPTHSLSIDIAPLNCTWFLGKPIEAREKSEELTLHEVFAPTLNAWLKKMDNLVDRIDDFAEKVELYEDIGLIKILTDALDWSDAQLDKTSKMHEHKINGKLYDSCPSCKVNSTLLRYIARTSEISSFDYWLDIISALDDLAEKKTRKMVIVTLLSHWQTVICSQIQLFDHQLAHKYRCVIEKSPSASKMATLESQTEAEKLDEVPESPTRPLLQRSHTADVPLRDELKSSNTQSTFVESATGSLPPNVAGPSGIKTMPTTPQRTSGHRRQGSNATVTGFQPGHRRGPSSATQATLQEPQPKKEDLYHWILRAQKEYKQRRELTPKVEPDLTHEVNPMELLLSVFFWRIYEQRTLDKTAMDSFSALTDKALTVQIHWSALKLDVIEKKFLNTTSEGLVLGYSHHHFGVLESLELNGVFKYDVGLDDLQLRPLIVHLDLDYSLKVQSMKIVASLASVCLVNDLAMSISACAQTKKKPKSVAEHSYRSRLPSSLNEEVVDLYWTEPVMDKLHDYQRYASKTLQRSCLLAVNIKGGCNLKSLLLECMLTDLFISLTFMRISPSHAHHWSLQKDGALTSPRKPAKKNASASEPRLSDSVALDIKRANLVLSEHRTHQKLQSETKQILNCSLKQSSGLFEVNLYPDRPPARKLQIQLGDMEGDLPMHAQSIHEVVLRHGPELHQQLYRIVAQQVQYFPQTEEQRARSSTNNTLERSETKFEPNILNGDAQFVNKKEDFEADKSEWNIPNSVNFRHNYSPNTTGSHLDLPSRPTAPSQLSTSTLVPERQKIYEIDFELKVSSVELDAQLLPSLRTKYKLSKAKATGNTGQFSRFKAEVVDHQVCFLVMQAHEEGNPSTLETFTLPLPYIKASGDFRRSPGTNAPGPNPMLVYKDGGYHDVKVTMGPMEHTFSTDLLNQILFAEQSFRSELTFLLERLSVERQASSSPLPLLSGNSKPILFDLTFEGEGAPWIQLTASTPTATAVRFTIDGPTAVITNRLMLVEASDGNKVTNSEPERLLGRAKIQLNVKLGQLCKSAMYEEAKEELQEYATFMTQISAQNEEVAHNSIHNYIITLNRPILLAKATAIDKAILLWINYRNAYNYWREERSKVMTQRQSHLPAAHKTHQQPASVDMNMNLSLSIQGGLYICMPMFSDEAYGMSALLISLQKSDVSVCVKKELACHAKFEAFRIAFVDSFDEHSLSDVWLQENTGEQVHSNFIFFPEGSYYFCSSANPPKDEEDNAKWILSIQSDMKGMIIDFDSRIGKLMNQCVKTLSSVTNSEEEVADDTVYAESEASSIPKPSARSLTIDSQFTAPRSESPSSELENAIDENNLKFEEMNQLVGHENKIRWLEKKMHEQSILVTDLKNCGASEYNIELERRKLRILELARFKQFRLTMLDKLKRKVDQLPDPPTKPRESPRSTLLSTVPEEKPEPTRAGNVVESVDMNIDVQIKIETGHCILRANQAPSSQKDPSAQKQLTKRLSAKDLKSRSLTSSQSITTLQIPSLDAKLFYTSDDSRSTPPDHLKSVLGHKNRPKSNKCFYLALELAKMLEPTLVTPALADFLEQVVEPLPDELFEPQNAQPATVREADDGVPIVVLDTSGLPLDVFFHMTVYSSVIRFEGQQQRSSSAADCLLTLPSLTLMASTRKYNEQSLNVAGIYLSATLSNFEISIYSPHQQASSHDALAVKLDKFSITASRTKCPTNDEEKNKVQLVIVSNVGRADFNYDMRRLGELLSFPKPWYRKKLIQRVFFGEQSLQRKNSTSTTHSAPFSANQSYIQGKKGASFEGFTEL